MNRTALFLGAHPDDIEYGCAGTLLKLQDQGWHIIYQAFTTCEDIPGNENILTEWGKAIELLKPDWHQLEQFANTRLPDYNREIREILTHHKNHSSPSLVFTHPLHDLHQDHQTVAAETLRTFKQCSILTYPTPKSTPQFTPNAFMIIGSKLAKYKQKILDCYQSQIIRNAYPLKPTYPYYEPFEVIRWIL